MKKVPCSNTSCNQRRVHWSIPDEMRETVLCEVADDYNGKTFCSITCAIIAGYFSVTNGWIKDPKSE
jgi:hypothetical protein